MPVSHTPSPLTHTLPLPPARHTHVHHPRRQLSNEIFLPCMEAQPYAPPYHPSTCDKAQVTALQQYGPDFMAQFRPLMTGSKNGAFLDACVLHGSTNSSIDGRTNVQAFEAWLAGGQQWYTEKCGGSDEAGPCDPSPICAPF